MGSGPGALGPTGTPGPGALYDRRLAARSERWSLAGRTIATVMSRPEWVLRATGRTDPVERGGRVLDRGVQALLALTSDTRAVVVVGR